MIRTLGAMVDANEQARKLVETLETRLAEERVIARGGRLQKQEQLPALFDDEEDRDLDEAGGAELEEAEQQIADRATSAQTIPELEAELVVLRELERLADRLRKSGQDAKWRQLSEILDSIRKDGTSDDQLSRKA